MSTTAIIIEHLVSGLQALFALIILLLALIGYDWINFAILRDFAPYLTFLGFAFAYPLGIFIDELADCILQPLSETIRSKRLVEEGLNPENQEIRAFCVLQEADDRFVESYLRYIRMRIRISRSTAFNVLFLGTASVLFVLLRINNIELMVFISAVGFILMVFATWSWYRFTDSFSKNIARYWKGSPSENTI